MSIEISSKQRIALWKSVKITNHNALYDKPLKINYIGDNRSSKSKKHNNRKSHKRKKAKNGRQKRRK